MQWIAPFSLKFFEVKPPRPCLERSEIAAGMKLQKRSLVVSDLSDTLENANICSARPLWKSHWKSLSVWTMFLCPSPDPMLTHWHYDQLSKSHNYSGAVWNIWGSETRLRSELETETVVDRKHAHVYLIVPTTLMHSDSDKNDIIKI